MLIIAIVIVVLAAIGYFLYKPNYKSASQPTSGTTTVSVNTVNISNFSFDPPLITVKASSAVTFSNSDSVTHTVTADGGKFNQEITPGKTAAITISEPGTYAYHCSIHPAMKGTIVVQ